MQDKINDFLLHQTSLKQSSKETYRNKLLKFLSVLDNEDHYAEKDILNIFETDWFKNLKISTQNLYKKIVRLFLKHLGLKYEYIKTINHDPESIRIEDIPTKEEINALLNNMPRAMDRCLVMVFLEGLRLNEARNVRIRDVVDKKTNN